MHVISVRRNAAVTYPPESEHSPDQAYPESPVKGSTSPSNQVYALVRQSLQDAGADAEHFGSPQWNPLGNWIHPGSRVFMLPNLVVNRREGEALIDFQGKCTHGSVLRAVLDYAVIATRSPELVGFGNAPLQSCNHARVSAETGMSEINRFYREQMGANVGPFDLRGVVTKWTRFGALVERQEQNPDDAVLVDLGADSLLDEFYQRGASTEFRVTDYDRREIAEYHAPGKHIYVVNRRVLEADTIISVPKLKTHEKVGITCALKGTVGTIARKECLAHHRKGGPRQDGDEFPHPSLIRHFASSFADSVTTLNGGLFSNAARVSAKVLYKVMRLGRAGIMAGAWHGNDTAWRMTLDIARILRYARVDGTMADTPQRQHLAFIDGIVGGEAEGPVYPVGRQDGLLLFGSDPVWADYVCALLMHFYPESIPLIANAAKPMRYPITDESFNEFTVSYNGERVHASDLLRVLGRGFTPPKGWSTGLQLLQST